MKNSFLKICLFIMSFPVLLFSQAENKPVILEAEEGVVGSEFNILQAAGVDYVSISTNGTAGNPQSANRVITFNVHFPAAQNYDLYVRCRVGPQAADDDSFFYGSVFGTQDVTSDAAWIRVNNINTIGYTGGTTPVDGNGGAGVNTWKWINLSEFTGDETPVVFTVASNGLDQTFQIGAREDGLDIDKIAFARADYFFTVANLDNGEEGSADPGGGSSTLPIADGKSKFLGNVYSAAQAPGFENYWNQVTPENAGKWGSVEATRDVMNWSAMDAAYNLAKDNGFKIRYHVLVWGNQQPAWIEELSTQEQRDEIEEWFQAVASRYPDLDYIEVVNEPLHDPPNAPGSGNYINALGGSGATGWDWVLEAFRLARQYFPPTTKLVINDYNIINSALNTQNYMELIELLKAENLVDCIGFQAHAFSTSNATNDVINFNLNALATLGLPIMITEMDIDGPTDQAQLLEYQRVFPLFWEHPSVIGITLWGYRPGLWRPTANLIESDGTTERPALEWLREYVENSMVAVQYQQETNTISVSPNPILSHTLEVHGLNKGGTIFLFDLNGYAVWSGQKMEENVSIRLPEHIPPGMYILMIQTADKHLTKKFILQ